MAIPVMFDYFSISFVDPEWPEEAVPRSPRFILTRAGLPMELYAALTPGYWDIQTPLRFYENGFQERATGAMLHCHEVNSGRHLLQLPGRAREAINTRAWWPHLQSLGRFTRIDVAWDIPGWETPTADWYDQLPKDKRPRNRYTRVDRSETGTTLYVGRRTHTKMLRIYDKSEGSSPWGKRGLRVELELKGKTANRWGDFIDRGPSVFAPLAFRVWPELRDLVPGIAMANAVNAEVPPLRSEEAAEDATRWHWWTAQVVPGWRNWYKEFPEEATEAIEALIKVYTNY